MDGALPKRSDQELGGAPEGLDALVVAGRLLELRDPVDQLPELTGSWV